MRVSRALALFLVEAAFLCIVAGILVVLHPGWRVVVIVMPAALFLTICTERAFARRAKRVARLPVTLQQPPEPATSRTRGLRRKPAAPALEQAPMPSPLQRGHGFRPPHDRVPLRARLRPKKSYGVRRERPERIPVGARIQLRFRRSQLGRPHGGAPGPRARFRLRLARLWIARGPLLVRMQTGWRRFVQRLSAPFERWSYRRGERRAAKLEARAIAGELAEAARVQAEEQRQREEEGRREAELAAAAKQEAERLEAERAAANRREEERVAAEQREAALQAAAALEAAEQAERAEEERRAADLVAAERREAALREAAVRQEAEERKAADRLAAEHRAEAQRQVEERAAAARAEEERREAERIAAERREAGERAAAARAEEERREAERLALAAAQREADGLAAAEQLAEEQREAEQLAAEQREAALVAARAEREAEERAAEQRRQAEQVAAQERDRVQREEAARRQAEEVAAGERREARPARQRWLRGPARRKPEVETPPAQIPRPSVVPEAPRVAASPALRPPVLDVPPAPLLVDEPIRVQGPVRASVPREWNLWELETLAREDSVADPIQEEERSLLLLHLRPFASAEGILPIDFDDLVRESFGELLTSPDRV